jgi:hypothetical protein
MRAYCFSFDFKAIFILYLNNAVFGVMASKNIFYNSHHSPVGAFASLTLGYKGASGGLGMELPGPACQNVYIGVESKTRGQFQTLPFYKDALEKRVEVEPVALNIWQESDMDAGLQNDAQSAAPTRAEIAPFADDEITREITPACDCWRAGDLEFRIYSPFLPIPDPQGADSSGIKMAIIPAVFVEFTFDNTSHASPRKTFFGYEGNDPYSAMRRYGQTVKESGGGEKGMDNVSNGYDAVLRGIGQGRITGIFTNDTDVDCALAFSVSELLSEENISDKLPFGLGTAGLMLMTARAGEKRTWRFAVCFYRAGVVTSGREMSYLYTRCFRDIEDVGRYGLENFEFYKQAAIDCDKKFPLGQLSDDRRFLLSQAIKSYYGCTQLLVDECELYLWVVVEGAYRMMNTLDLAVDQLFFEMKMNPWVVRSILDQYLEYSYVDNVKDASGKVSDGGISFTHDMGVANVFSKPGASAYELRGLTGCYSYMTQEQLVNWILCAGVYWSGSFDNEWLKSRARIFVQCLSSMINRDGVDDENRDGVMDLDSTMTGAGAEITTYDNVDTALGRARRSSYLAVKCWAAYLTLEKILNALGFAEQALISAKQAERCADTILKYRRPDGTIPALLEEGNMAMTLSLVEGLTYPYIMNMFDDTGFTDKYNDFIAALKKHFETALNSGCKFAGGGWKMSKTSDNSWPSKTFLLQFISEKIFQHNIDNQADEIHASWLLDKENAHLAFSDQMKKGKICGSAYYPRGVTAILWC